MNQHVGFGLGVTRFDERPGAVRVSAMPAAYDEWSCGMRSAVKAAGLVSNGVRGARRRRRPSAGESRRDTSLGAAQPQRPQRPLSARRPGNRIHPIPGRGRAAGSCRRAALLVTGNSVASRISRPLPSAVAGSRWRLVPGRASLVRVSLLYLRAANRMRWASRGGHRWCAAIADCHVRKGLNPVSIRSRWAAAALPPVLAAAALTFAAPAAHAVLVTNVGTGDAATATVNVRTANVTAIHDATDVDKYVDLLLEEIVILL